MNAIGSSFLVPTVEVFYNSYLLESSFICFKPHKKIVADFSAERLLSVCRNELIITKTNL